MKLRIEISSLATLNQSGVSAYTRLLTNALAKDNTLTVSGHYFNFLSRQPDPNAVHGSVIIERTKLFPLRVYAKLQSYSIAPAFDIFLPKVDLTIFPNFATWPRVKSKLCATVIHDLTYFYFPELVEEKNLSHLRRVVPRSIEQADFIITVSESVKAELIKEFDINPNRCVVTPIPPGVDFFKVSSREIHKKYGIPTERYIYFIGNLEPRKNLSTLLEAYLQLPAKTRGEYSLIIAGSRGWKNEALQHSIQAAIDSGENVRHIGFVDQIDSPALYQGAGLFVMPSLYEGFGMPILEAMASGCQVVASNIPVLRETGGESISYADPHDPADFAKKIEHALKKSIDKSNLRQLYSDHLGSFSWQRNVDSIVALCKELQ